MSAIFLLHKIRAIVLFILSSPSLLLGTYNNDNDGKNSNNKVRGEYKNHWHYTEGNYIYYNVV